MRSCDAAGPVFRAESTPRADWRRLWNEKTATAEPLALRAALTAPSAALARVAPFDAAENNGGIKRSLLTHL